MPKRSKAARAPKEAPKTVEPGRTFPKLMSTDRVAEVLDISVTSVKRLIRTKQLVAIKVGTNIKVAERDLWVYLTGQRRKGVPGPALPADPPKNGSSSRDEDPRQDELPYTAPPPVNLNDNVIVGNHISGNAADTEDAATPGPTGINLYSVAPVWGTVI